VTVVISATAPGKIILFGEHAVVYGRPAIAAPVSQLRAKAEIEPSAETWLVAPDLGIRRRLAQAGPNDPLAMAVRLVQTAAGLNHLPGFTLTVTSDIPVASGLGSGAAIIVATIRASAAFVELTLSLEQISRFTYQVEKIFHGTPSGIDNTVITYERPVFFMRQEPRPHIEPFRIARPLQLLIADTGVHSSTKTVVADVRRRWEADRPTFEAIFDACAEIALAGRQAIETGDEPTLGRLMTENQQWLARMTVSSKELDCLVAAALAAGALGAKLSGAGRGGNMIALVTPETEKTVHAALYQAGARTVLVSTIQEVRD
jgi:mevalonate kinase